MISDNMCIITHPGQAHQDEFIACSLILAVYRKYCVNIYRRNPTEHELQDQAVWVVDVGLQYDLNYHNFDHHQNDPALPELASSASLVADAFNLDITLFKWWEGVDRMDCTGPFATAKWAGTTWDVLEKVANPIGYFMVSEFGNVDHHHHDNHIIHLMTSFGLSLFDYAKFMANRMKDLDELATVLVWNDFKWIIMLDPSGIEGLESWVERNHPDAVGTVTADDRGPGICLYRRNDHPAIDFRRCESMDLEFIHKNGFCAKTTQFSLNFARIVAIRAANG